MLVRGDLQLISVKSQMTWDLSVAVISRLFDDKHLYIDIQKRNRKNNDMIIYDTTHDVMM